MNLRDMKKKREKRSIYVPAVVPWYCYTAEQTTEVGPFSI